MRIIAGRLRGRVLSAVAGKTTRPMLDRVRQAVFDWLGSRWAMPGYLPAVHVADLFAGSGALGIEALSRGAADCCFVEKDAAAATLLRGQLDTLGLTGVSRVVTGDALRAVLPTVDGGYDLLFLDPPYPISRDASPGGPIGGLLSRIGESAALSGRAIVVLRHEKVCSYSGHPYGRLACVECRDYGSMTVTYLAAIG